MIRPGKRKSKNNKEYEGMLIGYAIPLESHFDIFYYYFIIIIIYLWKVVEL